jgi:hypothetical protein
MLPLEFLCGSLLLVPGSVPVDTLTVPVVEDLAMPLLTFCAMPVRRPVAVTLAVLAFPVKVSVPRKTVQA